MEDKGGEVRRNSNSLAMKDLRKYGGPDFPTEQLLGEFQESGWGTWAEEGIFTLEKKRRASFDSHLEQKDLWEFQTKSVLGWGD